MKANPIKETRLLLNLYPVNSVRLNRIDHLLKMEGKTRTWWINAAVREKLDRDHPETNCPESEYKPAPIPLEGPAALEFHSQQSRFVEHTLKILQSFVPAAPLAGLPPPPDTTGMSAIDALDAYKAHFDVLNDQERDAILDAASTLAELPSGEPIRYPKPKKTPPVVQLELCEVAPVEAVEAAQEREESAAVPDVDFWGDDSPDLAKVRSLVKRHTR